MNEYLVHLEYLLSDPDGKFRLIGAAGKRSYTWNLTAEQYEAVKEIYNRYDEFWITERDGKFESCEIYVHKPLELPPPPPEFEPDWSLEDLFENTDERKWKHQEDGLRRLYGGE